MLKCQSQIFNCQLTKTLVIELCFVRICYWLNKLWLMRVQQTAIKQITFALQHLFYGANKQKVFFKKIRYNS